MADPRIPNPRKITSYEVPWHMNAACRGISDPEIFFPTNMEQQRDGAGQARDLCLSCPVRYECLKWALENREKGTWGGLTEAERDRLRVKRDDYATPEALRTLLTEVMPACFDCGRHRKSAAGDEGVCDPCTAARRRRADRPECTRTDCDRAVYAKDQCKKHYQSSNGKKGKAHAEAAA